MRRLVAKSSTIRMLPAVHCGDGESLSNSDDGGGSGDANDDDKDDDDDADDADVDDVDG